VSGALYYYNETKWEMVPSWVNFFIELGSLMSRSTDISTRLIVGVAIPTRSYAAALTASGVVITRSRVSVNGISSVEHFKRLCELEPGTAVTFLHEDRKLAGIITDCSKIGGVERIGVRVHNMRSGGLTYRIAAADALKIEVAATSRKKLPKKQTGKLVLPLSSFAHQFLDKAQAKVFARESRLECTLLGRINAFKREILNTRFAIKTSTQEIAEGTLQDILRARRFLKPGEHYRSEVFRVDGKRPPISDVGLPHFTIFDGATSFLRWRDSQRNANWIIFLDRTEPYFRDAASLLDQEYISNRINDEGLNLPPVIPLGIEIVSYYESR
jgi:hypothetical protein